nr:uncharacterized protein LOC123746950 [Procambarus clarkii]
MQILAQKEKMTNVKGLRFAKVFEGRDRAYDSEEQWKSKCFDHPKEPSLAQFLITDVPTAPPGCLQYHREPSSEVRSLNYGGDFRDELNYDICFSKLARSQKTDDQCNRKFTNIELDQSLSYRHRSDLIKKKGTKSKNGNRFGRSSENYEHNGHSSSLPEVFGKEVNNAFSDVISQVSKAVEDVRSEADLREGGTSQTHNSIPLTLLEPYTSTQLSSNMKEGATTMKTESSDQSPTDTREDEEDMATESVHDVLPILYSEGNEAVISQIQRVVQQLQLQHTLINNNNSSLSSSDKTAHSGVPSRTNSFKLKDNDVKVDDASINDREELMNLPEMMEETKVNNSHDSSTSNSPSATTFPMRDNIAVEGSRHAQNTCCSHHTNFSQ